MKKRYYILAAALLAVMGSYAAERTTQQKMQIAKSALGASFGARAAGAGVGELKVMDRLTVIGGEGVGFAVVTNDDANEPVIAVSKNSFDTGNMPDGLAWWLEAANEALADGNYVRETRAVPADLPAEVAPMLTCEWGQGAPFNDQAPSNYPSGCVATAMSQIMYYHKYPTSGQGSMYDTYHYQMIYFNQVTYDYNQMLDRYTAGNYTEAQGDAVATLMFHCGITASMSYAASGSGTHAIFAAKAMAENFRYNPNIVCRLREYYPSDKWMSLIYNELAAKRPILYCGSDDSMGGHAFVFTGYNAEGLVYVNWGWDGDADGYYDVNLLNPHTSAGQDYSFYKSQNMVTGIVTPDVTIPHESQVTWSKTSTSDKGLEITLNGTMVTAMLAGKAFSNSNYYDFNGKIHLMLEGNGEKRVLNTIDMTEKKIPVAIHVGDQISMYQWNCNQNLAGQISKSLPAGTYTLYLGVQDNGYDEITPMPFGEGLTSSYTLVKKDDGTVEINPTPTTGIENAIVSNTTADDGMARVYTVDGVEIYAAPAASFSIDDVPAKGLLIVKKGGETTKVMKN